MTTGGNTIKSNTGKAQIKKQGQTTSGAFGDSPTKKARYGTSVKNLEK